MEKWGDWDERKEGRKDREVRDDTDTGMEKHTGLDSLLGQWKQHITLSVRP